MSAVSLLGGLIGSEIAPSRALATLPVSLMVVGVAMFSIPASALMKRIGRRNGFRLAAVIAAAGGLLAAWAVGGGEFWLFCLATFLMGANSAFVQQYRFAAAESVLPESAGRAVALVLVGGIVAGFLGPELAQQSKDWLPAGPYAGSFVSVALLYGLALILLSFMQPIRPEEFATEVGERPWRTIVAQPAFVVAALSAAVAYGVMTFMMTATPVHLHQIEGYTLTATTRVIQSHLLAMFVPSLFSGLLIERLGVLRLSLLGVGCLLASVLAALVSHELLQYWAVLVMLGVGWNFLFVGATVLLTRTYRPAERFKAQATNDFIVFGTQAMGSLSAGTVLYLADWQAIGLISLFPLLITLTALLSLRRRFAAPPAEAQPSQI
jgi:MFS family permease